MNYNKENIFAKIIRGEIKANKIYEDENIMAFHDIAPAAPVHVLVIPKKDYINFIDFSIRASSQEVADFFTKVREIAQNLSLEKSGFRIICNNGNDASQSVPHFHIHILGKKKLGPLIVGDKNH